MKYSFRLALAALVLVSAAFSQQARSFATGETLRYLVNWPSGLSLGEVTISAVHSKPAEGAPPRWRFQFNLEAAIPGVSIRDEFRAVATDQLCSLEFEKNLQHGKRKAREKVTFDPSSGKAKRETLDGGGSSEIPIGNCAKDALTFLFYLRDELSKGRIAAPETVVFGAPYKVSVQLIGQDKVQVGEALEDADRLLASLTGPASEVSFMLVIGRGTSRRLLEVHVPLELGNFTMQLTP